MNGKGDGNRVFNDLFGSFFKRVFLELGSEFFFWAILRVIKNVSDNRQRRLATWAGFNFVFKRGSLIFWIKLDKEVTTRNCKSPQKLTQSKKNFHNLKIT